MFGLEQNATLKLYRHTAHNNPAAHLYPLNGNDRLIDVEKVFDAGFMHLFNASQASKKLGADGGHVAFFLKERDGATRFTGLYKILGSSEKGIHYESDLAGQARKQNLYDSKIERWYELQHDVRFSPLENRLIVVWPRERGSTRWLLKNGKEINRFDVEEIRSLGEFFNFPGFGRLILRFSELKKHLKYESTSPWVKALRTTRGIYLITDISEGNLYVGPATSEDGFWGRWKRYASNGHGGNKILKDSIAKQIIKLNHLQYSVVETMSNLATRTEGIDAEVRWKERLGSKALTLNGN